MSKEEDIKVYLEKLDKKALIDLYLQKCFDKDVEISDLEAKLAESEKNYKDARELGIEQFHSLKEIINFSQEEIDKFKQQLDEKEQENERLKEEICRYEITLMDKNSQLKKQNQDKISFAVEQLEKVKELFESCWDYYFDIGELCNKELFYNKIEQSIAELTHQHEDK